MSKSVLIATGGTGGHIFPAEALAKELTEQGHRVLFAGGKLSENRFFSKKYPFDDVPVTPSLKNVSTLFEGVKKSFRLIKQFHPDIIVGFGSYYSLPLLIAAVLKRIPLVLYAADRNPGKVIKVFSPFAKAVGINFPDTAIKGEWVGMPLRFNPHYISKEEAYRYYQLDQNKPVCLVFGGSLGAQELNRLAFEALKELPFQVIHFTGSAEEAGKYAVLYNNANIKAVVKTFEARMEFAWIIADIALTRAGAVSCAEELAFKVPGLLVPYPQAADDHQTANAEGLVKMGLCELIQEKDLTVKDLKSILENLYKTRDERKIKAASHTTPCTLKDLVIKSL